MLGEVELKKLFLEMGAIGVSLSGSGPTWYGVFDNFKETYNFGKYAYVVKNMDK